ncbi:hypothetical protein ANN_26477 [Periplaneta americana]|uniref:Uncharacterized protein n=1 Tax=Periplaneta americana TaxID=6978 RepID=A0ABQ8RYF1_PERAM|nr:hypothetical protein ANN_26477 [Periplaneta americana]
MAGLLRAAMNLGFLKAIQRRNFKIVNAIESEFETTINQFVAYSLALDQSTDRNDKAHLAIFIRGVNEHFTVSECLLDVITKYNWRRSFPGTERHHRTEEVEFAVSIATEENSQPIREITKILLEASKVIDLKINPEKTKYMIMSRDQNIVRNGDLKIGDLSFEEVEKFKCLGATDYRPNITLGEDSLANTESTFILKTEKQLEEEQFGFRKGIGTRDAIGLVSTIGERYLEKNKEVYVVYNTGGVIAGERRIKCIRLADDIALLAEEEILRDMLLELNDSYSTPEVSKKRIVIRALDAVRRTQCAVRLEKGKKFLPQQMIAISGGSWQ